MKVHKYLVLHSGDRILLQPNMSIEDITTATEYYNKYLEEQVKYCITDIKEAASHIELVHSHTM